MDGVERRVVSAVLIVFLTLSLLVPVFLVVIPTATGNVWMSTDWNRTYGGANDDFAQSMVQTNDGGYALAGYTKSYGVGTPTYYNFWLVKTDSAGNHLWNKTYGGNKDDYAYSLVQTGDGGYAIAGYTFSHGVGIPNHSNFWLVKTDSSGNMQWSKAYGENRDDIAYSLVQTGDGGYAIAGSTNSGASSEDFWLVKTDSSGNMQWSKTYGGSASEIAYSLIRTSDGGYAIAGYTGSYGAGGHDFWLIKADSAGNMQWDKTYGGTVMDEAYSVVQTGDGGYAVAGSTNSWPVISDYYNFWLVKTDSSGNMQWGQPYGGSASEIAYSLIRTSDGGYAVAGYTGSYGAGGHDFWLVKTDSAGNMRWSKTYGGPSGDECRAVVQTSDGGYAIAGSTSSYPVVGTYYNFWLVKITPSTIHIRADGSVDPPSAPILRNENLYTLTDNIYSSAPTAVVVEKDGITLDGAGYTIQGSSGIGLDLSGRSGVTIKNAVVKSFDYGIKLSYSSGNFIQGNTIINCLNGIWLGESSNNALSRNFITGSQNISIVLIDNSALNTLTNNNITNNNYAVWFSLSPNNSLSGNSITANDGPGVSFDYGSYGNTLIGNEITNNHDYGVKLVSCSSNSFYHNNFVDNSPAQVSILESMNAWDDGYPSGGNFWSDYKGTDIYNGPDQNEIGHDGIGDTSRIFDSDNRDNYPLMEPWPAPEAATIIIGTTARITVLDPAKAYDVYTWEVFNNIGEGLLKYKPGTTDLTYGIAESYTVSPDGLNYTFTLRSGLQFTDGELLNATAVKWSIDRVIRLNQDPAFLVSDYVSSVDVLNPLTVRFNLKKAVAYFPSLVAEPPYFPVSSKSFPADETAEPTVGHYGPYKIRSWTRDVELVLEANPAYYGAPPRSKYIVTKSYTDSTMMRQALENGQIDIAWKTLEVTDATDLKKDLHFNFVEDRDSSIRFMVIRCNMTPFDDIRLRRAVAAAINRTRIGTEAYSGLVDPLYSMVPVGIGSHIDAFKDEYGVRNLTLSRELLTAAGYSESEKFQFDLWYPLTHYGDMEDVATVIKSDLEETGMMQVTLMSADWATYRANWEAGVMPVFFLGWLPDYVDPDAFLAPFVHSTRSLWLGARYNYNNTVMDAILNEAMVEQNMVERTALYEDAQRLLAEDAPRIPFIQGRQYAVTKSNVIGVNLSLTGLLPYYTIYELAHPTEYPWAMFHHDLIHTGYSDSPTSRTNDKLWNYTTGSNVYSSPAVADGKVYVGSSDGKVYCLNALNGTCLWSYPTGGQVESSPAVSDLRVYVGSYDNKLYCLDALTGASIWNYTTNNDVRSSPAVFGGKVYVGSLDGKVYCLDASTGAYVWNYTTGGSVFSSPAVDNGKVYIGSNDTKVYCLNALTGAHIWNYTTGNWVMSSPAVVDGKVYVGSDDRKIYCLDASTGAYRWSYTTGYSPEHFVRSSPAVAYGKVYVGSFDFKLYCLDASTGGFAWSYTTPSGFVYSSPAIADGKVYVGSNNNIIYCLDALTGDYIWSYTTSGPATSSPAVADGIVFIGSNDKAVYAFGNIIKVPEDYPTVQAAVNAAATGDTILIAPGVYYESVIINNKALTILGEKGSGTEFHGGGSGTAITITGSGASGTNVAQVTITNYAQGISVDNSAQCRIFDNIMYSMTDSGIAVKGSNAANTLVYNNIFQNNYIAVNLTQSSTSNTIYGNTISYNNIGLILKSGGNTIYANTISQNNFGIKLLSSNDNFIYWNNFANYVQQVDIQTSTSAWDKGYPMGGNYWSNYLGVDFCSGPTPQTQPGRDGIGDTPYTVYGDIQDHYPLMKPFGGSHDIGILQVICSKTIVGQGYTMTIQVTVLSYGIYTETRNIKIYANSIIATWKDATLPYRSCTTLTFTWTTTGFAKGDYNMKIYATPITGDDYTADNTLTDGVVTVVTPGDVSANGIVDIIDVSGISAHWYPGPPEGPSGYHPNYDINNDGSIDILDVSIISAYWTGPPKGPLAP